MKVLITGAGGNLGRVLAPALVSAGHVPKLFDFRPLETQHESLVGDVRNPDDVGRAVEGVDAIVHGAAVHGIHFERWGPQDFWSINATGTFNVYEAAAAAEVRRFVLCSTMTVYGKSQESPQDAWAFVTEDSPALPNDIYGMTKLLCEQMAPYYSRTFGIDTTALRFGMFVPESFERYGFRLLFGGVDDRDVAHSVLLALHHRPPTGFDYFNIFADTPFTADDARPLHDNMAAVLERYWPGCNQLFESKNLGLEQLIWRHMIWRPDKARRVLGYQPRYSFSEFLDALRTDERSHYPFADLPRWGV